MLIPIDTLLAFVTASALLGIAPGPDNLYVLSQSALRGSRVGLMITLGLCSGLVLHTLLVALGVAAILVASPLAFGLLKLCGAGYLLYLAWHSFRQHQDLAARPVNGTDGLWAPYRRGVLMNLGNPKVSIFFLAFLPQFADPGRGDLTAQLMLLGALFMLVALLLFSALALLVGRIGQRWLANRTLQTWLDRVAGTVLAGLAIHLLLEEVLPETV